jgi:hypothetical protein
VGLQSAEWRIPDDLPDRSQADWSAARVLVVPSVVCGAMIILAALTASLAGLDVRPLFVPYISSAAAVSVMAILIYTFVQFAMLAHRRADDPLAAVRAKLIDRAPLMLLPALVLPLFLIGYTASKCAIQFLVGYGWDEVFANADKLIFGDDVWHLTRRVLGSSHSRIWEWFYTVGWGAVFFIAANAVALFGSKRLVGVYFTAMLGSWLIGGCLLAYGFSAAGPVFAGLFDPELARRFAPMRHALDGSLGSGPIGFTQDYLSKMVGVHIAMKGGGMSAMPSMHLASASIYVLAARCTRWLVPAIAFWLIIFVASGYFGYHYWVDGIAAAIVAAVVWRASEAAFADSRDGDGAARDSVADEFALLRSAR